MYTIGVITISDRCASGEREDRSGPALQRLLKKKGYEVSFSQIIPDEINEIKRAILDACDTHKVDLLLTTGGTGLSPRDVTPEATREVIEREAPGFSEVIRQSGLKFTPYSMISRGVSGLRGNTLIINLPGSVRGSTQAIEAIMPALGHSLAKIKGDTAECGEG